MKINLRNLTAAFFALAAFAGTAFGQAPATCVISGTVVDGGSNPVQNTPVRIRTVVPTASGNYGVTTNDLTTKTDASGNWSLTVIQGLKAQVDIPAVGIASDIIVPSGVSCPAAFGSLTLYARGTQTPATIISTSGPSMGGDLTGTSPNPSVIALRGQALAAGNCTNGQARVYSSGSNSYTCQTVTTGSYVQSVSSNTGITTGGTATNPILSLSPAGVTSTQLGAGAAAANIGSLTGALSGTLPSPSLATGAAATNVGALGGDLSGSLPSPSVASVGGTAAATVAAGAVLANAATSVNTPSTIVKRDGSGNFNAGTITAALAGNASTASSLSASMSGDATSSGLAVTVTGLQGRPVANTAPTTGYGLFWSGTQWAPAAVTGTVSSVQASGGTTGFSFTGGPITSSGTLTLTGTLGIANGGTGQTGAGAAFNALSPMTTLGDVIYGGASGAGTRLGGNTTTTKNFLTSTGSAGLATAPAWGTIVAADLPATITSNTSGTAAGLSATLAVGSGGTGQTTASAAFNALSPTTTLGDISYANGAGTNARLAGNTTSAKNFLTQTGTGVVSAAPAWGTIVSGDLPASISSNTSGTAAGLSSTLVVASGGSGAATFSAGVLHANGTAPFTSSTVALGSEVSGTLPVGSGGTGQTTAAAAYNALSPTTTLGDIAYANGAGTNTRLAGNTTTTKQFLSQTGNGTISAAPAWGALIAADIPNLDTSKITTGTFGIGVLPSLAGDTTGTITSNTNVKIQGRAIANTAPADLQYLGWNNGLSQWEPKTLPVGSVSSVNASGGTTGFSFSGGPITSSGTLTMSGTLAIANGGTGQTTATAAFDALSPMTALGDTMYGGASGTRTRLAGNTTTTKKFLTQTGDSVNSAAPAWGTIVSGDLPATIAANTSGTAANVTGTVAVPNGGTGATTLTGVVHGNGAAAMTAGAVALATEVSGQLPIANGGTNATTAATALSNLGGIAKDGTVALTGNWGAGNFRIDAQNTQTLFNVKAYGAVLDGTTDDTTAFGNALTAASSVFGVVYIPPSSGGMRITSGQTIPRGVSVIGGGGANNTTSSKIVCDLLGTCLTMTSGAATNYMSRIENVDIRKGASVPTTLLLLNNVWFVEIANNYFLAGGSQAIKTTGSTAHISLRHNFFQGNPANAVTFGGGAAGDVANAVLMERNEFTASTTGGVYINSGLSQIVSVNDVYEGNTGYGIRIDASSSANTENILNLIGSYFEGNTVYDIDVNPAANAVSSSKALVVNVTGARFNGTSTGTGAMRVNAQVSSVNVTGGRSLGHTSAGFVLGDLSTVVGRIVISGTEINDATKISSTNPATTGDSIYFNPTVATALQISGGTTASFEGVHMTSKAANGPVLTLENIDATSNNASLRFYARGSERWRFVNDNGGTGAQVFSLVDRVNFNNPLTVNGGATNGTVIVGGNNASANGILTWDAPGGGIGLAVPGTLFTQTATSVTTANTLTTLFGTGVGTLTLPANMLVAGRTIRVTLSGYVSTADGAAGTKTLSILLGGSTVATGSSGTTAATVLNNGWTATATITCYTAGVTGTVWGNGEWKSQPATSAGFNGAIATATAATTVNTTGTLALDVKFNNGNATGAITTTNAIVEILN